jgi:hypothetical protein
MEFREVKMDKLTSYIFLAAIVAVVGAFIGYQLWIGGSSMPSPIEGFGGPAMGSGVPDCLRTSADSAALYSMFAQRAQTAEDGPADLQELQVLLGKLACLKKDLLGAGGVVQATYRQPFRTSQDMEPVAETAARCFAKTIPLRDVDLALEKWKGRGNLLVKRQCTSVNLNEAEASTALKLFSGVMTDLAGVMKTVCVVGEPSIGGKAGPRMIQGFEPAAIHNLRAYDGYY